MLLNAGDRVEFYYGKRLLLMEPPRAVCVSDQLLYSVWYKPAGLMAQGTMYGDHCSIMCQAGLFFGPQHEVFLVHRLDREASGLMILAHGKEAASRLSVLFQKNLVEKKYRVEVLGKPPKTGRSRTIDFPLDGKPSITEYEVVSYDPKHNTSTVNVVIKTGRFHQIRRHFWMVGYPVRAIRNTAKGTRTGKA